MSILLRHKLGACSKHMQCLVIVLVNVIIHNSVMVRKYLERHRFIVYEVWENAEIFKRLALGTTLFCQFSVCNQLLVINTLPAL